MSTEIGTVVFVQRFHSHMCVFLEFEVWYRHSNQPEVESWPIYKDDMTPKSEREILADVGPHYITHLAVSNDGIPLIPAIANKLTHVQLVDIDSNTFIQRYLCLCEYLLLMDSLE